MHTYVVVWRKDGSLVSRTVEAEDYAAAYESFRAAKEGGGVPVKPQFARDGGRVTQVLNSKMKCLVSLVEVA